MPRRRVRLATRRSRPNSSGSGSGSFSYTATAGDGSYGFYTVATDNAGNAQATPSTPQTTTLLDTTRAIVDGELADGDQPDELQRLLHGGRQQRRLGAGAGGAVCPGAGSDWLHEGRDQHAAAPGSGSFSYTATAGDGSYGFYTVATDNAGNAQATPAGAQATTRARHDGAVVDGELPGADQPDELQRLLHGGDNTGGSGLAQVALYAQAPGQTGYTLVAINYGSASSGQL